MNTEEQIVFYTLAGKFTKVMLLKASVKAQKLKAKQDEQKGTVKK